MSFWTTLRQLFAKAEPLIEPVIPVIVQATLTATASRNPQLAKTLEQAMADEVMRCYAEGITDSATILARKLAVRAAITKLS